LQAHAEAQTRVGALASHAGFGIIARQIASGIARFGDLEALPGRYAVSGVLADLAFGLGSFFRTPVAEVGVVTNPVASARAADHRAFSIDNFYALENAVGSQFARTFQIIDVAVPDVLIRASVVFLQICTGIRARVISDISGVRTVGHTVVLTSSGGEEGEKCQHSQPPHLPPPSFSTPRSSRGNVVKDYPLQVV
jgi:hypothetical protein